MKRDKATAKQESKRGQMGAAAGDTTEHTKSPCQGERDAKVARCGVALSMELGVQVPGGQGVHGRPCPEIVGSEGGGGSRVEKSK